MDKRYVIIFSIIIGGISIYGISGISAYGDDDDSAPANNPIKHIVVIMQENHSFDNFFGTFPGVNGIQPNTCIPLDLSKPSKGCVKPFLSTMDVVGDLPHGFNASMTAYDNGKMDGFIKAENKKNFTMSYYDSKTIPYYWWLAGNYTLADNFYTSVLSYSLPEHWFAAAAQAPLMSVYYLLSPTDPDNPGPAVSHEYLVESNDTDTIGDLLMQQNKTTWKYYDNPLFVGGYNKAVEDGDAYAYWNPYAAKGSSYTENYSSHFGSSEDIFGDIKNGTLPQVSWVMPTLYHSDHPPGNLHVGQVWVARVVDALMKSPDWNSTAIFLTWDEYGGFYDHVAPPHTGPFNEGFRVPLIIISPYAKQGYVDHTQYNGFETTLKFIEWRFDLPTLTERDALVNNPLNAFNFSQTPKPPHVIPLSANELARQNPMVFSPSSPSYVGNNTSFLLNGFGPNELISLFFDNNLVATSMSNESGSAVGQFTIPPAQFGNHTVYDLAPFGDLMGGGSEYKRDFKILPSLSINYPKGPVGTLVTVSGNGYDASRSVNIFFGLTKITDIHITNKKGSFNATFAVPSTPTATLVIRATDDTTHTSITHFTVIPSISINPLTGPVGTTVTVNANGFGASQNATVTYNGIKVVTASTTSTGSFIGVFKIPQSHGDNIIIAKDANAHSVSAIFTVS